MARVLCTLPNASEMISGVIFVSAKVGMVSEDISDEVAETFLAIPGYTLLPDKRARPAAAPVAPADVAPPPPAAPPVAPADIAAPAAPLT